MNEQDLRERMQTSVLTVFGPEGIDPAADVARGRRGLRRRRAVGLSAAAASVAAMVALGVQYVPESSAEPDVAQQTTGQTELDAAAQYAARVKFSAAKLVSAANENLDKTGRYTSGHPGVTRATRDSPSSAIGELTVTREWKQGGGTGLLWLSIAQPRYAVAKEKWCGPAYTPNLLRMTCTQRKGPNGRPIVIGSVGVVQNSKGVPYRESGGQFVRYVRPDGQVVTAAVLGMNSLERVADGLPKGVEKPAVTWQQLAALVTDLDLRLR